MQISGLRPSKTPPKFNERTPKREKKERKCWRERGKKREILGPTLRGGSCPHLARICVLSVLAMYVCVFQDFGCLQDCVCVVCVVCVVSSRFLVGVFKIFGGVFKILGPLAPPSPGPPLCWTVPPDRPKFRSFFSLSHRNFLSFFLSFGGLFVEFWWCF